MRESEVIWFNLSCWVDQLISDFKAETVEYRNMPVPDDREGKRRILRSLMNVRMPRKTAERTLRIQDEYLTDRAAERGVVQLEDIPTLAEAYGIELPFADKLSLWQGDITRLVLPVMTPFLIRGRTPSENISV